MSQPLLDRLAKTPAHAEQQRIRIPEGWSARHVHELALALGAPALLYSGSSPEWEAEPRHLIPLAPRGYLVAKAGEWELAWDGEPTLRREGSAWSILRELNAALRRVEGEPELSSSGGLVTLLSYDLGREIDPLPELAEDRDGLPWLVAIACPAVLVLPAKGDSAKLCWLSAGRALTVEGPRWALDGRELGGLVEHVLRALVGPLPPCPVVGAPRSEPVPQATREEHEERVRVVLEHLHAGNAYQVNVSQRFETEWEGSSLPLFPELAEHDPAPFSGWLRLGETGLSPELELVSNSPERLVRLDADGLLSEPIKGTRQLSGPDADAAEVEATIADLESSEKDRAELVMIVDLHRNDLGKVAAPGTVEVPVLRRYDRRGHVVSGVAEIRARLREGCDALDVAEAMVPAGSITGVPKRRVLAILEELEPWRRGPYTGSLGWLSAGGGLDLNVLIRSAWRVGDRLVHQVGGGIVVGSDPTAEHEECLAKGEGLVRAIERLRKGVAS
ncbi:MAG: anthranilate synthase component I family protein [Acidobacteriota bacterium]